MKNVKRVRFFLLLAFISAGFATAAETPNTTDDRQVMPVPTTTYTVASPRMSIIRSSRYQIASDGTQIEIQGAPYGAAENFARKDGEIKIAAGVRVMFCLSRAMEGVWYDQTYGALHTSLLLQRYVRDTTTADAQGKWVDIGEDKAGEVRKGPSITRAKVGVPVYFREPGVYMLRAIVRSKAQPLTPDTTASALSWPAATDVDTVIIKVKVVDRPILDVIPDEEPTPDPDAENTRPLFKEINANTDLLPADINGDEIVDMADLMTLSQQWCQEKEIPVTSID